MPVRIVFILIVMRFGVGGQRVPVSAAMRIAMTMIHRQFQARVQRTATRSGGKRRMSMSAAVSVTVRVDVVDRKSVV